MIKLPINFKEEPLYIQVYESIKYDLRKNVIKADEKLPSKRKLAHKLGLSLTTVDNAYAQLVAEGFIYSKPRSGYFACEVDELSIANFNIEARDEEDVEEQKILVDFSADHVDSERFPYHHWRKISKDCFNEYDENLLNISHPQGDEKLREAISDYVYQARGVVCTKEQIIIGAGTDNIIQILSFILGSDYSLIMENPVYNKARHFFLRTGHDVSQINIDERGISARKLENKEKTAVYVTPSHQFPLGVSMPINRRIQLLNWANNGEKRYIIEDDYDSEFRYDTRVLPSLKSIDVADRVVYLGTFSKSIFPSLRISYMILPERLLSIYHEDYSFFSSSVSKLDQRILNEFIRSGKFESHINKMRKIYKKKREILVEGLKSFGEDIDILGEKAGHHILVRLNRDLGEKTMCDQALNFGVKVYPISEYFNGAIPNEYTNQVLIGYGGLKAEEIIKGIELLKKAWIK